MKYFTYCPLDMKEEDAFERVKPHLKENCIVDVRLTTLMFFSLRTGARPKAFPDTYLVRVEPDGSTRIVDRNITG